MTEHLPRIRLYQHHEAGQYLAIRECVGITFYLQSPHQDIAHAVFHALEVYRSAVGPQTLGWYVNNEGEWQELDGKSWDSIREQMLHPSGANIQLTGAAEDLTGYEFIYQGEPFDPSSRPDRANMVSFFLPTEYLEAHGPEHVRTLALDLAARLPFNSGHAGLSFLYPEALLGMTRHLHDACFRYPGLDVFDTYIALSIGTRVKGISWLTFLGQPVLDQLGGAASLRTRLYSPDVTVQEMESERVVVTLGLWPEAGDTQQGRTLPAYRELAHILSPWLCQFPYRWDGFSHEDMRRWERRFLHGL